MPGLTAANEVSVAQIVPAHFLYSDRPITILVNGGVEGIQLIPSLHVQTIYDLWVFEIYFIDRSVEGMYLARKLVYY